MPFLKERLYGDYERDEFVNVCRRWIGLPDGKPGSYAPKKIETRWSEKEAGGRRPRVLFAQGP